MDNFFSEVRSVALHMLDSGRFFWLLLPLMYETHAPNSASTSCGGAEHRWFCPSSSRTSQTRD